MSTTADDVVERAAAAVRRERNGCITPPSEGTDYDRRLAIAALSAANLLRQSAGDRK